MTTSLRRQPRRFGIKRKNDSDIVLDISLTIRTRDEIIEDILNDNKYGGKARDILERYEKAKKEYELLFQTKSSLRKRHARSSRAHL